MARHLGVSKAVLNNVIFCHQEDSTWYVFRNTVVCYIDYFIVLDTIFAPRHSCLWLLVMLTCLQLLAPIIHLFFVVAVDFHLAFL